MDYTISNESLCVVISDRGAELQSIQDADGTELLWQGDAATWPDRACNLFPYVGRLTQGKYTYHGEEYRMDIHGFLKGSVTVAEQHSPSSVSFTLKSNPETMAQYPFSFVYTIKYSVCAGALKMEYNIENFGAEMMYFAFGGHPGFIVPNCADAAFDDYCIEFQPLVSPKQAVFTETCFVTDERRELKLDGEKLHLKQGLFDNDAIILEDSGTAVRLKSEKDDKIIEVSFEGFPYLGLWNWPRVDVNYICIEPWSALPSRDGVIEDLETQPDLIHLAPGERHLADWTIEIRHK